jgi:hypothetical protein
MIDGVRKPVLSMAKNKEGDYISDIIGQFIDGYVDISKEPWIMRLGATPNVAGTWLYLLEIGVPAKTVSYFMNQPIIRDYLARIDNAGYSWLFIDNFFMDAIDEYAPAKPVSVKGIPSDKALGDMIGKSTSELDATQLAQQQYMLKEFLKYAKTASHLFDVTQGSNFDTATINDPYLVFKKMMKLKKARASVISSVDDILDNSFVGTLKDIIMDYRDAFSEILISDKASVRSVMEDVLMPYIGMSDRDFVKIAQKAVSDMFDWAVQTNEKFNRQVTNIMLGSEKEDSVADQIMEYVGAIKGDTFNPGDPKHALYNNIIINSIRKETAGKGRVNNLYLKGRDNKVYDQNMIIAGFNELREHLKGENNLKLYEKLTRLALLQSGLSNSPIAFTNLLPYEDFKDLYNNTLYALEEMEGLEKFYELDIFQRNNANNSDVATYMRQKVIYGMGEYGPWQYKLGTDTLLNTVKADIDEGILPKLIGVSTMSGEARSEFIVFQWEDDITPAERAHRRKTGNTSHIHKVLAKKVYREKDGKMVPVIQKTAKGDKEFSAFIYKAINVWGDSYKANEFYNFVTPSVLVNDYEKVTNPRNEKLSGEVEDEFIAKYFRSDGGIEANPEPGKKAPKKEAPVDKRVEKVIKNSPQGKPGINRSNKKC